jgi:2-iminoacetate synthase ThiH
MTPATARAALAARADDFDAVLAAADACRSRLRGNDATYVVNRNINYTNVW